MPGATPVWFVAFLTQGMYSYCSGAVVDFNEKYVFIATASHCLKGGAYTIGGGAPASYEAACQVENGVKAFQKDGDLALLRLDRNPKCPANGRLRVGLFKADGKYRLFTKSDSLGQSNRVESFNGVPVDSCTKARKEYCTPARNCNTNVIGGCAGVSTTGFQPKDGDSGGAVVAEIAGEPFLVGVLSTEVGTWFAEVSDASPLDEISKVLKASPIPDLKKNLPVGWGGGYTGHPLGKHTRLPMDKHAGLPVEK